MTSQFAVGLEEKHVKPITPKKGGAREGTECYVSELQMEKNGVNGL